MDILLSRWGCYGVCQCRCSTHFLQRFGVAVRSHGCFGRCPKMSLWMSRTGMGRCMCVSTHANIIFAGWSREWAGGWPCGQSPILWGIVCIFSWGMLLSSSICFFSFWHCCVHFPGNPLHAMNTTCLFCAVQDLANMACTALWLDEAVPGSGHVSPDALEVHLNVYSVSQWIHCWGFSKKCCCAVTCLNFLCQHMPTPTPVL